MKTYLLLLASMAWLAADLALMKERRQEKTR
jgi:hypothetical protein